MSLEIEYGIWGKPFAEQIKEQGYKFKKDDDAEFFDKVNRAFSLLHLHHLLTDKEWQKGLDRLHKKLIKAIVKVEE